MASGATSIRRKRAVESFRTAAEALGPIEKGASIFAITRGQWSMIDAIVHCLHAVGPAHISLWAWTVASWEIESLRAFAQRGDLLSGLLVVDRSVFSKRSQDTPTLKICGEWQAQFGEQSIRYITNHAKMCTIESLSGFKLLLRGSLNLNFNPRFEQFDLTEGGDDFALVKRIEAELPILTTKHPDGEIRKLCGVTDAMTPDQVAAFKEVKPWRP